MYTTTTSLGIRVHLEQALLADKTDDRRYQLCFALEMVAAARVALGTNDGAVAEQLAAVAGNVRQAIVVADAAQFTGHMRAAIQRLNQCDEIIQTSGL